MNYNTEQLEYVNAEVLKSGFSIVGWSETELVKIKFITADLNAGAGSSNPVDLLKLNFNTKQLAMNVTCKITLTDVVLANEAGVETEVTDSIAHEFEIVVRIKGDLNGDGQISIGDLALMVAQYYGKDAHSESNWHDYKIADLNDDDVIDIEDLRELARIILN